MKRLFVYGCSHATVDFNLNIDDKSWPELVAAHMNMELHNKAVSGYSNDNIFLSICDEDFKSDDVVLVLMTFPHRVMLDEKLVLRPSQPSCEWWYKQVSNDVFYQANFLKCLMAIQYKLKSIPHLISFVDPSLLLAYKKHKKLITNDIVFLPKLTLSKSFALGDDKKHMSNKSHKEMSNFWISKLQKL